MWTLLPGFAARGLMAEVIDVEPTRGFTEEHFVRHAMSPTYTVLAVDVFKTELSVPTPHEAGRPGPAANRVPQVPIDLRPEPLF